MDILCAVFQGGIELNHSNDRWVASSGVPPDKVVYPSLQDAASELSPLQIVLVTERRSRGGELTHLLRSDGNTIFGVSLSDLTNRSLPGDSIDPVHNLAYLVGAVSYHCQRMAQLYVQITSTFAKLAQIPGQPCTGDIAMFGFQPEPYFEFEALVSAARRSFDSLRVLLWRRFGVNSGSMPRSLQKLLEVELPLPETLRDRLNSSWQEVGARLTDYRDCIHHYVPVDYDFASARMQRLPSGVWTTRILIPDNPEARSKAKFVFAHEIDALEYSYEVANELLELALEVTNATLPRNAAA
jgi:hypothetical protein